MFKVNRIKSNQQEVHIHLLAMIERQKQAKFRKPISEHTRKAFDAFSRVADAFSGNTIVDACCGVGESTVALSKQYPDCLVVGIDKSIVRLEKNPFYHGTSTGQCAKAVKNVFLLRADLADFWRLLSESNHKKAIKRQYILYPNPYPKKTQLVKRWYASPIMKYIISTHMNIECRSNWLIYLKEFQQALSVYGIDSVITVIDSQPLTPFERKYMLSGQDCWKLETVV